MQPDAPAGPQQELTPKDEQEATELASAVAGKTVAAKRELQIDHGLLMSETQLLLAERRTAFSQIRTGISVSLVPISVGTVLVATSHFWDPLKILWLFVAIMVGCVALLGLGGWLVVNGLVQSRAAVRGLRKVRRSDTLVEELLLGDGKRPPAKGAR